MSPLSINQAVGERKGGDLSKAGLLQDELNHACKEFCSIVSDTVLPFGADVAAKYAAALKGVKAVVEGGAQVDLQTGLAAAAGKAKVQTEGPQAKRRKLQHSTPVPEASHSVSKLPLITLLRTCVWGTSPLALRNNMTMRI